MLIYSMMQIAGITGCNLNIPEDESPGSLLFGQLMEKTGQSSHQGLVEKLTSDDADVRREAVMALSSGKTAQLKSTPELLGVVALDDKDALVKATAVEALAQYSQWPRLTDVLAQTATDENAMVRLATVQVLDANKRSESLIILLDMLEAETDNETRSEIADALGYYPDRRVLRGLIETVAHDDFRVSYSSRQSLVTLTGQDHQYDDDAWRKWLAETTQPFSGIPDPSQ